MKSHYTIPVIALFIFINCISIYSKTKTRIKVVDNLITYNARNGNMNIYPVYRVKQNGYIIFEVKDINLFRYKVTLTEQQNNIINSTNLSEFKSETFIDPTNFNLIDNTLNIQIIPISIPKESVKLIPLVKRKNKIERMIEKKTNEIIQNDIKFSECQKRNEKRALIDFYRSNIDTRIVSLKDSAEKCKEQKNKVEELKQERYNLTQEKQILNINNQAENDSIFISKYIKTDKNKLNNELDSLKDQLISDQNDYDSALTTTRTIEIQIMNFNYALENYALALNKLNSLTEYYERLVSILYSDQSSDQILYEKRIATQDIFQIDDARRDEVLKLSFSILNDIDTKFLALSKAYSPITPPEGNDQQVAKAAAKAANEVFDRISVFNSQIRRNSFHSFFRQLIKVYDAINVSNFNLKYQTLIISDNADLINYNLKAEPLPNMPSSIEVKPFNFKYNVKIQGGVKIDVSTGIFWNIGLFDQKYRFEKETDSTTLIIKEKNRNLFTPYLGILLNI